MLLKADGLQTWVGIWAENNTVRFFGHRYLYVCDGRSGQWYCDVCSVKTYSPSVDETNTVHSLHPPIAEELPYGGGNGGTPWSRRYLQT